MAENNHVNTGLLVVFLLVLIITCKERLSTSVQNIKLNMCEYYSKFDEVPLRSINNDYNRSGSERKSAKSARFT